MDLVQGIRDRDAETIGEKIVRTVRTDNEPILRSRAWGQAMRDLEIQESHSVPFCPQMNGTAERFMRTLGGSMRAVLLETDDKLWAYACKFIGYIWNRLPRTYKRYPIGNGRTPYEIRNCLRGGVPVTPESSDKSHFCGPTPGQVSDTLMHNIDNNSKKPN